MTNLSKEYKALLDMISFSEGTLGVSQNGYDVLFGGNRFISGWDKNTTIVHGGSDWIYNKNGITTTAAGRYQFLYGTWIGSSKINKPMTEENQNNRGAELIDYCLRNFNKSKLNGNPATYFEDVRNLLSNQWTSCKLQNLYSDSYDVYLKALKKY